MNFCRIPRPFLVIRNREVIERIPEAYTFDIKFHQLAPARGVAIFYDEDLTMVKEVLLQPLDIVKPEYIGFGAPETAWTG